MDSKPEELLFYQRETKRWEEAITLGANDVLSELHTRGLPFVDFIRKDKKLRVVRMMALAGLDFAAKAAPNLFERIDGRPRWNRYLTALRFTLPRFRSGLIVKSVLTWLRLKEAGECVESYAVRLNETVRVLFEMFKGADEYVENWGRAEEISREYGKKPQEGLVALYTSFKTFPEDKQFVSFREKLEKSSHETITIVIEDGIKFFLMIAEDFIEVIVRLPMLERMEQFDDQDPDRAPVEADLKLLFSRLTGYLRDSEHRELLHVLLRKAAERAIKSWYEEEEDLRRQHRPEMRSRFTEQFEKGLIL